MKLEIWMIVGVGIGFAVGLGAITMLLLGLHAELRRLSGLAEDAHQALLGNLKHALAAAAQPPTASVLPSRMASPPESTFVLDLPGTFAASAPTAALEIVPELTRLIGAVPPSSVGPPPDEPWSPDRRLLVMRLAGRGRSPDQIAAALQIPQDEVETFLEVNQLIPASQKAGPREGL